MEVNQHLPLKLLLRWSPPVLALALSGCAATRPAVDLDRIQRDTEQRVAARNPADPPSQDAVFPGRSVSESAVKGPAGRRRLPDSKPQFVRRPEVAPKAIAEENVDEDGQIQLVSGDAETPAVPRAATRATLSERLKIPSALPGATAEPLMLPPSDPEHPERKGTAIEELFPGLPALHPDFRTDDAPDLARYTLTDLEQMALRNNPKITQAAADVEAAVGAAIQSGAYPNPTVGYEADTVGSGGTRNYQGMFFDQTIITAGKLELNRAIANVDLMNKQLELRKARALLLQNVRNQYYAVLVARESLKYSEALVTFTNEVYQVQVEQLKGGQAAAYEPMQLRVFADQSRSTFRQAQNRYKSAWKQLAAALGDPNLPVAVLEGDGARIGQPIDYEAALAYMLSNHTDVLAARNLEFQGRLNVRLAEVTPIPDVKVYSAIQRDFTTPPVGRTTYNLQVGVPVPIFNQNRGGIQKARGELVRATEQLNTARVDLSAQLADAFERYEDNRIQLDYYRDRILPDLARVYRGVYERHQQVSEQVGFGDIIVAQQNLITAIATYVSAMNGQWTAYADIAGLLQLEDLSLIPYAAVETAPALPAADPPAEGS